MKWFLIFLTTFGSLLSANCRAVTFTEDLEDDSDAYGVFWVRSDAADPKDPAPMDHGTVAEFDQKVTVYIKDLGDWWTIKKQDGLTDEKTLESFINTLVLVIDGVPLKKLQPIAVTSYTPSYPYHKPKPATLEGATKIWKDWHDSNVKRNAESQAGTAAPASKAHRAKSKKPDASGDDQPTPSETFSNGTTLGTDDTAADGGDSAAGSGKGLRYHLLTFELSRETDDQGAWMQILRPEKLRPETRRRCRVSVGFERKDHGFQEMVSWVRPTSGSKGIRGADQFYLVAMPPRMLWAFGIVFTLALIILVLAGRSGMLRDPAAPPRPDGGCPYSLARCQMAFWLLVIVLAFVFLWQMLGRKDTVNDTATILLGISSFTAVGAALIVKKEPELQPQGAGVNYAGFLGIPGFFKDLLTDSEQKLSIARFQMLVWTSTLGIVFVVEVLWKLAMPDFNASILALLGITSGTYLGFKGAETKAG